jgi:Skp family chaperone for outer membrane proteins
MKSFRSLLIVSGLSLAIAAAVHAADAEAGYIDIGKLVPSVDGEFVEVNLSPGLLKFAAKVAAKEDPEAAEVIGNIKRIRVNVVGLDATNRDGNVAKIEEIRRQLEVQGWMQMVTVRDKKGGDNVDIHVKHRGDEAIEGLVITVIDSKGEAVFVNIVGDIRPEQLSKLASRLHIDGLDRVAALAAK